MRTSKSPPVFFTMQFLFLTSFAQDTSLLFVHSILHFSDIVLDDDTDDVFRHGLEEARASPMPQAFHSVTPVDALEGLRGRHRVASRSFVGGILLRDGGSDDGHVGYLHEARD